MCKGEVMNDNAYSILYALTAVSDGWGSNLCKLLLSGYPISYVKTLQITRFRLAAILDWKVLLFV